MTTSSPQTTNVSKKPRNSNLELYRIICMIMIVAHHYIINSGLTGADGVLLSDYTSSNSIFMTIWGAWGKTGINCFLMITGYFMCTSKITIRKFVKLLGQVYLYKLLFFVIFLFAGYETVSATRLVKLLMPVWGFTNGFVPCFIAFWLSIPFLSILVQNLNKRQHQLLLMLSIGCYTILGSLPTFDVSFNYITWFGIIFFIASYIRLYPNPFFERKTMWGLLTIASFFLAIASILGIRLLFGSKMGLGYNLVSDSNKIFAVAIAVCSFLWFKNLDIKHCKIVNAFGAGTFGVLLIHANSDAMRTWLWNDVVDVAGYYYALPTWKLALYSVGVVLTIFLISNLIDQLRILTAEKWFLQWYDKEVSLKADNWVNKLLKKQ